MNSRFKSSKVILFIAIDIAVIYAAYMLSFWMRTSIPLPFTRDLLPEARFGSVKHYFAVLIISHVLIFYFFGIYERRWKKHFWDSIKYVFIPCIIGTFILISVYFFRGNIYFPRSIFIIFPVFTIVFTNLWRNLYARFVKPPKSRTIIVGVNPDSINLIKTFKKYYGDTIEIVGIISFPDDKIENFSTKLKDMGVSLLGDVAGIKKIIKNLEFNEIILTPRDSQSDFYIDEISRGKGQNISIYAVPGAYEILLGKLKHTIIYDIPMVAIKNPGTLEVRAIKRIMDLALAILILILTAPVFLLTALGIKITSPGPMFYKQERMGRGGKTFIMYKFRSMIVDAEKDGAMLSSDDDRRVTAFGKFIRSTRIDELPQLFNIITGSMSFVGPRPERKEFVREFIKNIASYRERLRVKPGITGLAQVRGVYHTDARIKLRYDLAYIANYSIWLDLKILIETIRVILTRKGA